MARSIQADVAKEYVLSAWITPDTSDRLGWQTKSHALPWDDLLAGGVQHLQVKRTSLRERRILLCPPKRRGGRCGLVQEKFNGQGSEAKQPRAEEAKTGEAKVGGCAVGLDRATRAAGGTNAYEKEVGR
jgi:hypothetical protein